MKNHAMSIRAKLKNFRKLSGESMNFIELQYVQERFLYRLSQSEHKDHFILKGGTLFYLWAEMKYRPTKDLDFMFNGDFVREQLLQMVKEICQIPYLEDGIEFQWESFRIEDIKEDHEYDGVRIHFDTLIGNSRIAMNLDVCTGDKITPAAKESTYPNLLKGFSGALLKTYPKETVIAEKVHAMLDLDLANSRMKDYFDVYILLTELNDDLDMAIVKKAIAVTFDHRNTKTPAVPVQVWESYFHADESKNQQWNAFLKRNNIALKLSLEQVCIAIAKELNPLFEMV